jgi:hypothetical protein
MAESQAGCTIWGDVSKETFERFAQFAYTGDYSIPEMEKRNVIERFRELGDCFLVNEELRWAAIDVLANDEFKKSGIEDSVRVILAILRWPR